MKRVSILALLVLILAAGVLPAAAITNGELDWEGHPNVGLMIAEIDGEPEWRCSGTLVAPRVFLTAGHCVGDGATWARVWFNSDFADVTDYPYGGEMAYEGKPVPHPLYLWGGDDPHDVGVVILEEAVDLVPAALPPPDWLGELKSNGDLKGGYGGNSNQADGVFFRSVGYGRMLESWPPPVLVAEKVRQVSESEYVALTKVSLHLSQKAVFDESGSCFGDSGGPVFWVHPVTGQETIVAVTSSGDAQCVATGINYRVDQPYMVEWVLDQIELAEQ